MLGMKIKIILLLFCALAAKAKAQEAIPDSYRIYNIGNSHTWDHRPSTGFMEIAKSMDIEIINGWHINCGKNIHHIWNNPEQVCVDVTRFGFFKNAIGKHEWDAITIQPFVNGLGKNEAEAIKKLYTFIRRANNPEAQVFVYCSWPKNTGEELSDFDYSKAWLADFNPEDTLRSVSEDFFAYLEKSVNEFASDIQFVPLGRVIYHFDQKAKAGEIPEFSGAGELYRDRYHMNNVGRYMAGLTMFSGILGIDPRRVPDFEAYPPSENWPSDRVLTGIQKKLIRQVIAEVLE
jgi:hypothetical protein